MPADAMAWWFHAATFLYFLGLLASLGVASATRLLSSAARYAGAAAALLLAGVVARLAAQTVTAFGEIGITLERVQLMVTATPWGRGWLWQAVTALFVLTAARSMRREPGRWRLLLVAGVLASVSAALTGHAVAFPELSSLAVPVHAAHIAAGALWLGTLAWLLVAGARASRHDDPGVRATLTARAIERFSPLALVSVAVLAGSGLIASVLHVGSFDNLFDTSYGQMLIRKIVVFAAAAACGAWNWRRVRPALASDPKAGASLRRIGGLEVSLGILVLILTSILVALPMPAEMASVE